MTQHYRTTSQEEETVATDRNSTFPQGSDRSQASIVDLQSMGGDSGASTAMHGGSLLQDPKTLHQRWESIQVGFVDNPRQSVGEAEKLVSLTIGEIANVFRDQREKLEASWSEGSEPSTDDLRTAFQSYRDFFGRLLQV
jgi:hypothetical protein